MPKRLTLCSQVELVSAYETLREAIVSSGHDATAPTHAWRLVQEGLLAWGLCDDAARHAPVAYDGAKDGASEGTLVPPAQAPAAVVSLLATLTLQSMTRLEVTS